MSKSVTTTFTEVRQESDKKLDELLVEHAQSTDTPIGMNLEYAARVSGYRLVGGGDDVKMTLLLDNGIEVTSSTPMRYEDAVSFGDSVMGNAVYPIHVGELREDAKDVGDCFDVTFNFDRVDPNP